MTLTSRFVYSRKSPPVGVALGCVTCFGRRALFVRRFPRFRERSARVRYAVGSHRSPGRWWEQLWPGVCGLEDQRLPESSRASRAAIYDGQSKIKRVCGNSGKPWHFRGTTSKMTVFSSADAREIYWTPGARQECVSDCFWRFFAN